MAGSEAARGEGVAPDGLRCRAAVSCSASFLPLLLPPLLPFSSRHLLPGEVAGRRRHSPVPPPAPLVPMPFVHLPERGVNQYYCTNPIWHYSTSLCAYPQEGPLDPAKPNLLLLHSGGSSSAAQQRQFHDERLKRAFNLIAMDAAFHGWTTGAQRDNEYGIQEGAENFLCALDKLFAPRKLRFSVLGEGRLGVQCATWMAVSRDLFGQDCEFAS